MKNNAAKLLTGVFIIIFSLVFTLPTLAYDPDERGNSTTQTQDAQTTSDEQDPSSGSSFTGGCRTMFLGLKSWDCDVNISNEDTLKSGIWIIAANIATDIAMIAAYLIIGYVIYGGYLYTFSSGDPGKVATAKKTLTQAFIGLAIVLSANLIMSTIRIVLVGGQFKDCARGECVTSSSDMVINLINWFIGIAGVVSAVFLIYGGIMYITSTGDPNKVQKAKQTIMYSLIGLAIVALSATITAFVSSTIRDANNNALINNSLISKEVHEVKNS